MIDNLMRCGFRLAALGVLGVGLILAGTVQAGDSFTGKVIAITDGDIITVLDSSSVQHKVRLQGVDAPELIQPFSMQARQFLSDACFGQAVTVKVVTRDKAKQEVADVILPGGTNLSHKIVGAGLAWWYRSQAPNDKVLADLEKKAKQAKLGLWEDANPTPPWESRRPDKNDGDAETKPVGHEKTFTFFNPVTSERETTTDPQAASDYLSKGWMLESSARNADKKGANGKAGRPSHVKTFTFFNPVTSERETTTDPQTASDYLSKGWLLESSARTNAPAE